MLHVKHVITSLEVGGAQRMLSRLLERMDPGRFRSSVVSLVPGGAWAARIAATGSPVGDLGMRAGVPDPRGVLRLRRILRRDRPDVLQTWLYHADLVGTLAARWARIPALAWNLRCTHSPGKGRGFAARVAPRLCAVLSRSPRVIVTNSRAGRESHEVLGYRPRAWQLVPNGFDLEAFAPAPRARQELRAELGLPESAVLCGVVARWHPMKNIEGVLRLSTSLRSAAPDLHFVLAGEGLDAGNPELASTLARLGARDRIHALGPREDVAHLMAGFDFLLSASTYFEGFPNVLGEALACGVPCVASDVGDSAEVVGDAGFVAAPTDAALGDAVLEMAALSPEHRAELGRRGRARVAERYELGHVVRAYESLYLELAGGTQTATCAV